MIKYNIILDEYDFTKPWDNFSSAVCDQWDWVNETLTLAEYDVYFDQEMIKQGMNLGIDDHEWVTFNSPGDLSVFLLKWS